MRKYLALLAGSLLLLSCGKSDNNPVAPEETYPGKITGTVNLYNTFATLSGDHADVLVSAEGQKTISTATTADGKYTLSNIPAGKYTLVFSKPGFGTYKIYDIQHNGTSTLTVPASEKVELYAVATAPINGFSLENGKILKGTVPPRPDGGDRVVALLAGKSKTPTPTIYDFSQIFPVKGGGNFSQNIDSLLTAWKSTYQLSSGSKLFCSLHTVTSTRATYLLPGTNTRIYPSLSAESVPFELAIP